MEEMPKLMEMIDIVDQKLKNDYSNVSKHLEE
jgi:hypothetical protein